MEREGGRHGPTVVGLAEITFELWPSFVVGDTVLWGRSDFFRAFVVGFDELGQHFTLTPLPTRAGEPHERRDHR